MAVIEAKKAAVDPMIGKEQARQYAQALYEKSGHFPIIFYTNGHDIYLWDSVRDFPPRLVYGFYSKETLLALTAYAIARGNLCRYGNGRAESRSGVWVRYVCMSEQTVAFDPLSHTPLSGSAFKIRAFPGENRFLFYDPGGIEDEDGWWFKKENKVIRLDAEVPMDPTQAKTRRLGEMREVNFRCGARRT